MIPNDTTIPFTWDKHSSLVSSRSNRARTWTRIYSSPSPFSVEHSLFLNYFVNLTLATNIDPKSNRLDQFHGSRLPRPCVLLLVAKIRKSEVSLQYTKVWTWDRKDLRSLMRAQDPDLWTHVWSRVGLRSWQPLQEFMRVMLTVLIGDRVALFFNSNRLNHEDKILYLYMLTALYENLARVLIFFYHM